MNSLDDLRSTLDLHAGDLAETSMGPVARSAAVRNRVRVVRRRRRAVAAGGTAAVLAVVAGMALLPDGARRAAPEPATTVVGLTPPAQLSALGYDYELTGRAESDGAWVTVELPASDHPRLVSWGTSGDDDRVTIDGTTLQEPLAYDVDDFSDFYYIGPGNDEKVSVKAASGRPGIAIYTLGEERPAGITTGGVTYREAPAGLELLGADVSDAGDSGSTELVVPATATSQGIQVFYDCEGGPSSLVLHLDLGGQEAITGGRCGRLPVDAASGGSSGLPTTPGEDVTARVYVTDGPRGPRVALDTVRLTVGVYARTDDLRPTEVDAYFPELIESRGHLWRQVSRVDGVGDRELADVAPAGARPLLAQVYVDVADSSVRALFGGSPSDSKLADGFAGGMDELVAPGQVVSLRINGPVEAKDQLSIGLYEQVG